MGLKVDYSYGTYAYLLNRQGAEKLVKAKPLEKMVPVDEYLAMMYDRHTMAAWKDKFPVRDLVALSVQPLLVFPIPYPVSDTRDTDSPPEFLWGPKDMSENLKAFISIAAKEPTRELQQAKVIQLVNRARKLMPAEAYE